MAVKRKDQYRLLVIFGLLIAVIMLAVIPEGMLRFPSIIGKVTSTVRIVGSFSPIFSHDLPNITINQTDTLYIDVNCTDPDPLDYATYSDNFTGFDIHETTGVIYKSGFNESLVGNHTIRITCTDTFNNFTSKVFNLEVLNENLPPVLDPIGPQLAEVDQGFYLDVDATDSDGDSLTFFAATSLFEINPASGVIDFIPTLAQVGNHTVNISVFDGFLYDWEIVSFVIVRGPYCGDNACNANLNETCISCSTDCGECPPPPEQEPEQQEGLPPPRRQQQQQQQAAPPSYKCEERWECSDWGICTVEGVRARQCKDINRCGTTEKKPKESEECEYVPTCFDGVQNGGETAIDCGGPCQPCMKPSCFDGVQNQEEEGIDCGGPCPNICPIQKLARPPIVEIPGILKVLRSFPWPLLVIIGILLGSTITGDHAYVHKIRKKEFEEYREKIRKYRPFRRKLYKFVIGTSAITIILFFYIYYHSNSLENMLKYSWIPAILIISAPIAISAVIRHYTYYEYLKRKKEERLKQTHKMELLQLVKVENEILYGMETDAKGAIYSMAGSRKFEGNPEVYKAISPIYQNLAALKKEREARMEVLKTEGSTVDRILAILESKILRKAAHEFPEFMHIRKLLKYIEDNRDIDTTDREQELIDEITEISYPYMRIIVMANKRMIVLYNQLVDIYQHFSGKQLELRGHDEKLSAIEREFTDKMKEISKNAKLADIIGKNPEYVSLYNNLIDLFNHYVKKMELNKALEDI
ncbi:hypothetical protein J4212_05925 [Candidatus Woesearchaeota archaeon]|nr:hypothetical protein [Candidatus Woesearchaeota archaeon]